MWRGVCPRTRHLEARKHQVAIDAVDKILNWSGLMIKVKAVRWSFQTHWLSVNTDSVTLSHTHYYAASEAVCSTNCATTQCCTADVSEILDAIVSDDRVITERVAAVWYGPYHWVACRITGIRMFKVRSVSSERVDHTDLKSEQIHLSVLTNTEYFVQGRVCLLEWDRVELIRDRKQRHLIIDHSQSCHPAAITVLNMPSSQLKTLFVRIQTNVLNITNNNMVPQVPQKTQKNKNGGTFFFWLKTVNEI